MFDLPNSREPENRQARILKAAINLMQNRDFLEIHSWAEHCLREQDKRNRRASKDDIFTGQGYAQALEDFLRLFDEALRVQEKTS